MQSTMYGQGWFLSDYRGHPLVEHRGDIDGFSALVSLLPKENIGVVVLANCIGNLGYVVVRDIYDRLLGLEERDWSSHYKDLFAEIMEFITTHAGEPEDPVPNTSPSLPLSDYSGVYENPAFGQAEVAVDGKKLAVKYQSGLASELEHFHFDVFKGTTSDFYLPTVTLSFHLNSAGVVESFAMQMESEIVFRRL